MKCLIEGEISKDGDEMPNDAVERKFYLTPVNVEYIEQEKKVRGLSYSYTVNAALDAVRMKKITDRASEMLGPANERLGFLENNQRYMIKALNAIYRTSNYTSRLINNGLPVIKINGNNIIKADKSLKDLARKKTMDDYSKLRTLELISEDFMEEYPDDTNNEMYQYTAYIEPGDLSENKKTNYDIYPFN